MITAKLKTALTSAGCSLVLYESSQMSGIVTDQSKQNDIVGLVIEPNTVKLEVKGNGVHEHYPVTVEIMKQVKQEDMAENNETTLNNLLSVVKAFITVLVASGDFKKIQSIEVVKIQETRYDANLIGWTVPLDLYLVENNNTCS